MKTFPLQSLTLAEAQQKQFALVDTVCRYFPGADFLKGGDLGLSPGLNQPGTTRQVEKVLEEAQKRGALPYPVGAESKYEIPPLFYRLSGTFRAARPGLARYAIRINPNRSGEETVLRILRESLCA
ncbi:hypothetical protein M0L06_RS11770 [Citrobacter koseri]|nr:hypothetical protein [Citrobacter koseri]